MSSALVILTEELPAQPRELGPALAPALGMVVYDVIAAFKRSPLLPFEELDDDCAAAALNVLDNRGISAAVVPCDCLPPERQVFKVHNADVEEEGLNVQVDLAGKMRMIAWDAIDLLSAAQLRTEKTTERTHRPTGLLAPAKTGSRGIHVPRIKMPRKHKHIEHSEVIALWPAGMNGEIQFQSNAFNFDYLGERMAASQTENMRTFSTDIRERVEGALISQGFENLVSGVQGPPEMTPHLFIQYNRWLMLRAQEDL